MNSMGKVGTELAKNPFGYSNLIESNQYGFTLAYKWSEQFQITGAYGGNSMTSRYDSSVIGIDMVNAGDTATTNSWMIGLNFKDVFIEGNKAGFAIGGVPTVSSNDSGWGTDGSMPIALETWYQFQVTDNISVTPGVFWVSGQELGNDGAGKYGGRLATAAPMSGAASSKPSSSSDLSLLGRDYLFPPSTPFLLTHTNQQPLRKEGLFYCSGAIQRLP